MSLLIVVVLLFIGGGCYGYSRWWAGEGIGILRPALLTLLVLYVANALR